MKGRSTTGLLVAFLFLTQLAGAQVSCTYRLELFDSRGDGWNNAFITLIINGQADTYTLNGFEDNGAFREFDIEVTEGDTVVLIYTPGFAERENSFSIYNPDGQLLLTDGPSPAPGPRLPVIAICPSCPAPLSRRISVDDVRAKRADISWRASSAARQYVVEYGPAGFTRGAGQRLTTDQTSARLTGLQEKTYYDFYLFALCGAGDTSIVQGPFSFQTLWTKDVGISAILRPNTACGLGFGDTVTVGLTNFGGDPQTLIPFRYSVNGVDAGVPIPFDGFFTGVVGNDSTAVLDFETTWDFSQPGEYLITAWTEAENDQDVSNDTTSVTITNIPIITTFPYFEGFESYGGGWTVDTNSRRPSWEYGHPDGFVIDRAAGGAGAWATNLTGPYNDGELSYLLSPCLDFSSLNQDPRLAFSLFFVSERGIDRAWVDVSTDGGATWRRVGSAGTGLNWYNDNNNNTNPADDSWSGDGSARGWVYAYNTLSGTAGAPNVRLRFAFASDNAVQQEGFAIDNVFIGIPLTNDLAAVRAATVSGQDCGAPNDRVRLSIANFGTRTQSNFNVAYRINGGPLVTENVGNLTLTPNQEATYTFNATFNSSAQPSYLIEAFTILNGEQFPENDTVRFEFRRARTLPFAENFESGIIPIGWNVGDAVLSNLRNNTSTVLTDNLFVGDRDFTATTPVVGPVAADDTLRFDYRLTLQQGDGTLPKLLTPGEKVEVQISTDCGQTYTSVLIFNETNHTPSATMKTVAIPLTAYAGKDIKIKFLANWVTGDFWIDLDNVNIRRCPASLRLTTQVTNISRTGAQDGSARVTAGDGVAPFTYSWSNGQKTPAVEGLSAGTYEVQVTDRFGCTDVATVVVGFTTAVEDVTLIEELLLAPNPTNGRSRLQISFRQPVTVRLQVINLMGQTLLETAPQRTDRIDQDVDLSPYTGGMYLLRVVADGEVHTEKLLLAK